jgi:hypothetical protein
VRYYKQLDDKIIRLGFPATKMNELLEQAKQKGYALNEISVGKVMEFSATEGSAPATMGTPEAYGMFKHEQIDRHAFEQQEALVKTQTKNTQAVGGFSQQQGWLYGEIRNYRVANHSPVECMNFILELQAKIGIDQLNNE